MATLRGSSRWRRIRSCLFSDEPRDLGGVFGGIGGFAGSLDQRAAGATVASTIVGVALGYVAGRTAHCLARMTVTSFSAQLGRRRLQLSLATLLLLGLAAGIWLGIASPVFRELRHRADQWKRVRALEKELSSGIRKMSGITDASVVFESNSAISKKRASVEVRPSPGQKLGDDRVWAIRYFVSFAAGLKPENVTVTDSSTGTTYPGQRVAANNARPRRPRGPPVVDQSE